MNGLTALGVADKDTSQSLTTMISDPQGSGSALITKPVHMAAENRQQSNTQIIFLIVTYCLLHSIYYRYYILIALRKNEYLFPLGKSCFPKASPKENLHIFPIIRQYIIHFTVRRDIIRIRRV